MGLCLVLIIVVVIAVALHTRNRLVAMFTFDEIYELLGTRTSSRSSSPIGGVRNSANSIARSWLIVSFGLCPAMAVVTLKTPSSITTYPNLVKIETSLVLKFLGILSLLWFRSVDGGSVFNHP